MAATTSLWTSESLTATSSDRRTSTTACGPWMIADDIADQHVTLEELRLPVPLWDWSQVHLALTLRAANETLRLKAFERRQKLKAGQQAAFDTITRAVATDPSTAHFYIQGPGGTGKTFLCEAIYTGAALIIWDEVPMQHKHCFEAVHRFLVDMPGTDDDVLFGGDFAQILAAVPKGTPGEIVHACLSATIVQGSGKRCREPFSLRSALALSQTRLVLIIHLPSKMMALA
ncbi:uncharacterized protein CPUR_02766 [Claviceps purpurea 20.1]|uniref:ATP-dependent DNA helicase n=1 Tax=Claviceps purpurea (strain 20.1) TaxID=1111077 RepID=M1W462_CLAP2|nr:uncharacterized protein CPUR_02766 [Claviceps purpurea 20.1]